MLLPVLILAVALSTGLLAPEVPPFPQGQKTEKKKPEPKPPARESPAKVADQDAELERAVESAGNDRAAMVRNLKLYLERFPGTPRRPHIYRAIIESSLQLDNTGDAIEYAERLIALQPDDGSLMLLAVDLLERMGDDASLTKAVGYITRVLDRVEKSTAQDRPREVSPAEWEQEQKKLLMSLYLIRGRLEIRARKYDAATADLEKSYGLLPNPAAASRLGEMAEMRAQYERATEYYLTAFTLPQDYGIAVDRRQLRQKLGNVWRLVHGSEASLGEKLLAAYDQHWETAPPDTAKRNAEAKDLDTFVVRRFDGTDLRLSELRGKVMVLSFWATWCLPCREVETTLARLAETPRGSTDVAFLSLNCDADEALARAHLEKEKLRTPTAFEDGLRKFFGANGLPTVIVLDREGRVLYRGEGFAPANLEKEVAAAIERGLGHQPQ